VSLGDTWTDYDGDSATRFAYAKNGVAATFALEATWNNMTNRCPTNYAVTYAREFRCDGGRKRYMDSRPSTTSLQPVTANGIRILPYQCGTGRKTPRPPTLLHAEIDLLLTALGHLLYP